MSSGLAPDQKLSSLDDAATDGACEALSDSTSKIITPQDVTRGDCTYESILNSLLIGSDDTATISVRRCQDLSDECVAKPRGSESADHSRCAASLDAEHRADCDATAGEYEACLNEIVAEVHTKLMQYTCANAMELSQRGPSDDLAFSALPACKSFQEKCPNVELSVPIEGLGSKLAFLGAS